MTNETAQTTAASASVRPTINRISVNDLWSVLGKGLDDFTAMPTHAFFLVILYPIIGLFLIRIALGNQVLSLIFPLVLGFSFLGPIAAVGVYELSRRREQGLPISWVNAFAILQSPSLSAIGVLALILFAIFVGWIWTAEALYTQYVAKDAPESLQAFVNQILFTPEGQKLIMVGNIAGALFAFLVFSMSVVSFPMLIDRKATVMQAVGLSMRVVFSNLFVMIIWAAIIAAMLLLGALPALLGLAIILPVLGHATWHLYRKAVTY